jgi:hypothetical protein
MGGCKKDELDILAAYSAVVHAPPCMLGVLGPLKDRHYRVSVEFLKGAGNRRQSPIGARLAIAKQNAVGSSLSPAPENANEIT